MLTVLTLLESTILLLLAGVHFNWAFGGKWGFESALPTNEQGKKVLNPRWFDSFIVALGLTLFAAYFLIKAGFLSVKIPTWLLHHFGWIIATIFLGRAAGEFKYVGFFKKIKTTAFASADSKYFSPLCFLIAILAIAIQITSIQNH